ncbi:FRG domain-containing protein [Craterilacuibacter sinensis]|uniref:FRG domain-containing protein n=1 Tax=Craterilacuibacter sinensis TaxID=2686017 RepID=A0A845BVA2_9NEIS|nr:FRG domain-containing protein [Craterilacuibacter sinensis]MXR38076.1 FRG domain-containing protein [Craterilacuibacter sinensis]
MSAEMKQGQAGYPIEEIHCDSLDEFWDVLSPIGSLSRGYIFRGQRNASWSLLPSALRKDNLERYRGYLAKNSASDSVIAYELGLLRSFVFACDVSGLPISGDSIAFRKELDFSVLADRYHLDARAWPDIEFVPLLALAQHHAIPTRLLDWTYRSYVAAYFAAESALKSNEQGVQRLAVWALRAEQLYQLPQVEQVRLPGAVSVNMAAQQGCFVVVRSQYGQGRDTPAPSHDEYSQDSIDSLVVAAGLNEVLSKVTLPIELAGELLLRCDRFGVSAATLFPGYDGAARSALEFRLASISSGRLI